MNNAKLGVSMATSNVDGGGSNMHVNNGDNNPTDIAKGGTCQHCVQIVFVKHTV